MRSYKHFSPTVHHGSNYIFSVEPFIVIFQVSFDIERHKIIHELLIFFNIEYTQTCLQCYFYLLRVRQIFSLFSCCA